MSERPVLRTLIAEDEPLAREALAERVTGVEWLELVGTAPDGLEAVRLIDELRPDVLFLDVRMPRLTGLQVLERIEHPPWIVFTTAHNEYAVSAFELGAVDYLLKPFGPKRFRAAAERLRERWERGDSRSEAIERARAALGEGPLRRLFARTGNRIVPIPVSGVSRFEASGDYVVAHGPDREHLLSLTLTELEARLDPDQFMRVHRSHVVNLDHVARIEPHDDRRLALVLRSGVEVVASRKGSQRLRALVL